jgi:hypothetical protein
MLCILNGVTFRVSQSVEHPPRRLPANFSVSPQVPHRISGLLEFGQDLGDESMSAFGARLVFFLLALDIYPEFQLSGHTQFHSSSRRLDFELLSVLKLVFFEAAA